MALGRKTGGRTRGTPNAITQPIKEKITQLWEGYSIEKMQDDMSAMHPKDRFIQMVKLAEFITGKVQRVADATSNDEPQTIKIEIVRTDAEKKTDSIEDILNKI